MTTKTANLNEIIETENIEVFEESMQYATHLTDEEIQRLYNLADSYGKPRAFKRAIEKLADRRAITLRHY